MKQKRTPPKILKSNTVRTYFQCTKLRGLGNSRLPLSRDHIGATMLTSIRAIYKRKCTQIKNRYFINLH